MISHVPAGMRRAWRNRAADRGGRCRADRVALLVFVLALTARVVPVLRGGGVNGLLGYDDGVYFGAADALVSGRLPYRDFLLLHPPGVMLVLAPFAVLARLVGDPAGLGVARLLFMAVGATNAVLVSTVARRAVGPAAGVAAGLLYALWPPATYAERTVLLEPLVNLGLLGAAVLLGDVRVVTRRRLAAAGAALGAAVAVKLWAVLALVVFAGWLLRRRGPRAAGLFLGAAALVAAVVCLPFFVAAPRAMLRMVVLDQLGRPNNAVATTSRLAGVFGEYHAAGSAPGAASTALMLVGVTVAVVATAVVLRSAPPGRVWVVLLVAQVCLLLGGPAYYDHYGTFAAPALAVVAGSALGLVWKPVSHLGPDVSRLAGPAASALLVAVAGVAVVCLVPPEGRRVPGAQAHEALAAVRCVRADSVAALAETNVLSRDLGRGCPLTVDVTGLTYDMPGGRLADGRPGAARRADPLWQRRLRRYLAGPGAMLLVQVGADGLGPLPRQVLAADRQVLRAGRLELFLAPRG